MSIRVLSDKQDPFRAGLRLEHLFLATFNVLFHAEVRSQSRIVMNLPILLAQNPNLIKFTRLYSPLIITTI